jgi:hypothetical protein
LIMTPESRETFVCELMGALVPIRAAFLISILILELQALFAKAASTEVILVVSAEMLSTSVDRLSALIIALVSRRGCLRRLSIAMRDIPALAKYFVNSALIPVPPSITTTTLPLTDSLG